ncbi:TetR/AcrR family transcriptional regulator [Amycolatopsis cihanbeyliensis]|uniref:TetR family transcriptional regulator n=1 Tax=Amycolatopsis cihanbeyliensis TaxID=1128664 RepID=A0A542DH47_AMYCI|nr:TetR/AcrR family transcriptional regulator [Amycolatopsis cihanbeyliensis]TQJ02428.1 TetR family transcriptional regulator [Amycolatopsis cihanbeyliensis]
MAETTQRRNRPYAPRKAPAERREQLLDAALEIIVEQGIHKVSIDSVARRAGVTRPVVYGLFDDTNALLRASLDREEQAINAQLAEVMPATEHSDSAEAAIASLDGFLRAVLAAPDRWRAAFMLVDSSTPVFRERVERNRRTLIETLENLLQPIATNAPDTDIALLARGLYALLWEAGRLVLAEPDHFPPERITAFATNLIHANFTID